MSGNNDFILRDAFVNSVQRHSENLIRSYVTRGRKWHPKTSEYVQAHIDSCKICQEIYERTRDSILESWNKKSEKNILFGTITSAIGNNTKRQGRSVVTRSKFENI